jgi:branched-chain amino acid transport system ATP-binding protein
MTAMLEIRNLHAAYDASPVLHGIDLSLEEGSFIAVIGANTAGKSTLLRAISGLVPQVSGSLLYRGEDLLKLAAHHIPGRGIAHVPEGRHVFGAMSVEENLWLGGFSRREDKAGLQTSLAQIYAMFPRLAERRRQLAGTLSGGEQQMVAIGRALMGAPRLLLLDEPSHGLAPKIVQELHDALLKIHLSGVTILLVEQNTKLALSVASEAFVLQSGKVVLHGSSADLLGDARIREAYLGI